MEELKIITKFAWRNVWRNKRRTILTFLTIAVGCTMIIFMNAIAKGGHDQMIEDAVAINTGHIQIHENGYWENQTIDYVFKLKPKLRKALDDDERIEGYCPRIQAGGLLSFKDNTAPGLIQGIDPERENEVTILHRKVLKGGRFLIPSDINQVVIGESLAKNLNAALGDTISMISQGLDGSIAADNLEIVGLLDTGNPEYDRMLVLMPLTRAIETFSMLDYIHSVIIKVNDSSETFNVKDSIAALTEKNKIEVMAWDKLMPELVQFIVMDDVGAYIFDFILFMIVAFGILNTIQMSVYERTREFGIMLAIGTSPGRVKNMVLMESVFITIMGTAMGILLGYLISYDLTIDYSSYSDEMAVWGVSTTMFPTDVTSLNIAVTSITTFVLSILFSIFPAQRASQLKPIDAIRHL